MTRVSLSPNVDLTNVTFHMSPNIVIATHMNHLHTTQKLHIYQF
jgi:hypothetical protein